MLQKFKVYYSVVHITDKGYIMCLSFALLELFRTSIEVSTMQSRLLSYISFAIFICFVAAQQFDMLDVGVQVNLSSPGPLSSRSYALLSSIGRSSRKGNGHPSLDIRQTYYCPSGYVECGADCIPSGYTCCASGGGCGPSYYCDEIGGCCEKGKLCSAPGSECQDGNKPCGTTCILDSDTCTSASPTPSTTTDSQCPAGQTPCGSGCMLSGKVCCPGNAGSCDAGEYCVLNSDGVAYGCCANGKTCTGGGGGGGSTEQCASGRVSCGSGCISTTDTCCPGGAGYCSTGKYCLLDSGGVAYGCCANGKTCTGAADDSTDGVTSIASTRPSATQQQSPTSSISDSYYQPATPSSTQYSATTTSSGVESTDFSGSERSASSFGVQVILMLCLLVLYH